MGAVEVEVLCDGDIIISPCGQTFPSMNTTFPRTLELGGNNIELRQKQVIQLFLRFVVLKIKPFFFARKFGPKFLPINV